MSTQNTALVESLNVLYRNRPIREADIASTVGRQMPFFVANKASLFGTAAIAKVLILSDLGGTFLMGFRAWRLSGG